jgi:hypothetical protein
VTKVKSRNRRDEGEQFNPDPARALILWILGAAILLVGGLMVYQGLTHPVPYDPRRALHGCIKFC